MKLRPRSWVNKNWSELTPPPPDSAPARRCFYGNLVKLFECLNILLFFFILYNFILYLPLFPHSKHSEPRCPIWVLKRSTVGPFLWAIISFEHFLYNFFIYWWILTNLASKWPWERVLGKNGLIILFGFKVTCVCTSALNPP